jgi:hypothetical protein
MMPIIPDLFYSNKAVFNVSDYNLISTDFPVLGNPQTHDGNPDNYRNHMQANAYVKVNWLTLILLKKCQQKKIPGSTASIGQPTTGSAMAATVSGQTRPREHECWRLNQTHAWPVAAGPTAAAHQTPASADVHFDDAGSHAHQMHHPILQQVCCL